MRYSLTLTKIPYEARDEFRRLEKPGSYFEIRPGEVGDRVAYAVLLTPEEYERARRAAQDPSSNLIAVQPEIRFEPHAVPGVPPVNFLAMQGAIGDPQLDGHGVTVGILDGDLSQSVADSVFAGRLAGIRGYYCEGEDCVLEDGYGTTADAHGTKMASLAVPPESQLVFGSSTFYQDAAFARLVYWMVDEIGVDIISMSFGYSVETSVPLEDALSYAASQNVILFASRGNDSNSAAQYPALNPGVRAISAYDTRTGRISTYSSFGDLFAASVGDVANWFTGSGAEQATTDANGGGTSAATALAAHVAARLMTGGRSPGNVVDYLANNARRTGASPLYEGNGVLQLDSAANALLRDQPGKKNLDGTPGVGQDGCLEAAA